MIIGLGSDLCAVARVERELAAPARGFLTAVFTPAEVAAGENRRDRAAYFAALFATKEATVKAMASARGSGSFWQDVEVLIRPDGNPRVILRGRLQTLAHELGVRRIHASFARDGELATATVVLES